MISDKGPRAEAQSLRQCEGAGNKLLMNSHNDNSDTRKAAENPASSPDSAEIPRPTVEEIRVRAYEIYVERGRIDGQELDHWFQAERELTEIIGSSSG